MLKLLFGVLIEVFVAVSLAGLILALAIPLLNRNDVAGAGDVTARITIMGVLICSVAIALFRPSSAIRRHIRR